MGELLEQGLLFGEKLLRMLQTQRAVKRLMAIYSIRDRAITTTCGKEHDRGHRTRHIRYSHWTSILAMVSRDLVSYAWWMATQRREVPAVSRPKVCRRTDSAADVLGLSSSVWLRWVDRLVSSVSPAVRLGHSKVRSS